MQGEDDARWQRLFEDLASLEDPTWDEHEVADLARAETVGIRLTERLTGTLGHQVSLQTVTGRVITGRLITVAEAWLVLRDQAADHLVAISGIATVGPLLNPRAGARAIPLGTALRRIAARGTPVLVDCHVEVRGTIHAVGADHLEVRLENGSASSLPTAALVLVRCAPGTFGEA